MPSPRSPLAIPRGALVVLYTMSALPPAGATYRGLAYALGLATSRAVFKAVARAREEGLIEVIPTGRGRGARAVIRISEKGRDLLKTLEL